MSPLRWIIIVSVVLHGLAAWLVLPYLQTRMEFDAAAEAERAQLVQQREQLRQEELRKFRQTVRLREDQARELMDQEERRRRNQLEENVERLRRAREKAIAEREKALERIADRELREVLPKQIERLQESLRRLDNAVHQLEREARFAEEATQLREEVREQIKALDDLQKTLNDPTQEIPDYQAVAKEVAEVAKTVEEKSLEWQEGTHGSANSRAQGAENAAEDTKRIAEELQEGLNINDLNAPPAVATEDSAPPASKATEPGKSTPADLYETAVALEEQITQADRVTRAAELAEVQGTSVDEALATLEAKPPSRPDLSEALRTPEGSQPVPDATSAGAPGNPPAGSTSPSAESPPPTATVGDVNSFREAIRQATTETTDMARRAERITGGAVRPTPPPAREQTPEEAERAQRAVNSGRRGVVVDMRPWADHPEGGGFGEPAMDGLTADTSGRGGEMLRGRDERTIRVRTADVVANALPGRMLTDASAREGFLYIDTWYMIGPWDNWSRSDFAETHPPELRVDLDATYLNGKFAGQRNHPDRVLSWYFVQSDRIAIEPRRPTYSATYYAYTEVYSDRTREMLVAIASDDMAKVWINGEVIWIDRGQSSWNLDEGFRRVVFRQGFNTILVRLENGPAYTAFSVVLCPTDLGSVAASR